MSHQAFLMALSQMTSHQKARIMVDEHIILINEGPRGWNFSTEVFSVEGKLPSSISSCISPSGRIHVPHQGPYLTCDADHQAIVLIWEAVLEKGKYLPFRDHLKVFIEAAVEWRETLQMLADRECVAIHQNKRWHLAVLLGSLFTWVRSAVEIVYDSIL